MSKKGANSKAADPPPAAASAGEKAPTSWKETLEQDPEKKRAEEAKNEVRQRKAEEAAWQQQIVNERREKKEKELQIAARKQVQEENKWRREIDSMKARAEKEGIVTAQEYEDGTWWVDLGKGLYKECKGQYLCTLCDRHLNDSSLSAHIYSQAHIKKVEWNAACGATSFSSTTPSAPSKASAPSASSAAPPEEWQERSHDGSWRCIPCGKVVDVCHLGTEEHERRLDCWLFQRRGETQGYPTPDEPYVAYVPCDPNDLTSERWRKCLLCNKWVQDETSHTGTAEQPAGSIDHKKNLLNYCRPGEPWYEKNVAEVRREWHPPQTKAKPAPTVSVAKPKSVPKASAAPAWGVAEPRPVAPDSIGSAWAKGAPPAPYPAAGSSAAPMPVPVAAAQAAAGPAAGAMRLPPPAPPKASPPSPSGGFSASDNEGKTYDYHTSGVTQWAHPDQDVPRQEVDVEDA